MSTTFHEARTLLAPPPGDPHGPLAPLLVVLTVVTGLIDAFSYLMLGHVFVANMTGNVIFLAFALAGAKGFSIGATALSLGAFAVGATTSGRLAKSVGDHRGRHLAVAASCEAAFVVTAMAVDWSAGTPVSEAVRYVLVLLLALGTGIQNGTARKLAVPDLTTTVLTLTIAGTAADSRLAGGSGSRLGRRGLATTAMFTGALLGALLVLHMHPPVVLLSAVVLLTVVAAATGWLIRARPAWDEPG